MVTIECPKCGKCIEHDNMEALEVINGKLVTIPNDIQWELCEDCSR